MKLSVIAAKDLDTSLIEKWKLIQASDDNLRSPYYCPEFTQSVAACGRDVRVAVMESSLGVAGFFPYECDRLGRLQPVGGGLNDYHGAVVLPGTVVDPIHLLKACSGRYFSFNHMPLSQAAFLPYVRLHHQSPVMALSGGWDAYVKRLGIAQNKLTPGVFAAVRASTKRLERDVGPLRFEIQERTPALLDTVMRLKTEQRLRMGTQGDPFALKWVRQLLNEFLDRQDPAFRGALCALYAGDNMVACHFGLQASHTLHYWFPVYETTYSDYGPGLIMLMRLAEQGCQNGIELIDLGRGVQPYKMRFCTGSVDLGEGAISSPMVLAQVTEAAKRGKAFIKANPQVKRFRKWVSNQKNDKPGSSQ